MSRTKLALSFRIFQNGQFVREASLQQSVIKIGKVPSAHLRIDDDSISRMHAVLEVNPASVNLIDLGSTRGTFVNGKRINKATLQSGDVLQLGDVRVELEIREAPAEARVSPAEPARGPTLVASLSTGAMSVAAADPLATTSGMIAARPSVMPPAPPVRSIVIEPPPVPAAPVLRAVPSGTPPPPIAQPQLTRAQPVAPLSAASEATDELGGARAVEVAAMLGDSVVGVKHCVDPRGGKIRAATWGLFAAGVAGLLISATAFVTSVSTSADNADARAHWTRDLHRPDYAFRPHMLNPGIDWLAFGGLALGVIGVTLGAWRMRGERTSPFYRIGTAPGVELSLEQAPSPAFPLVAPSGDDFVFNYGAGIDGEMIIDGKSTPLAELAALGRARPSISTAGAIEVPLPPKARIRARAGQATFMVSAVPRPRRQATPFKPSRRTMTYVAGSLAAHLALLWLLRMVPLEEQNAVLGLGDNEEPSMMLVGTNHQDPPPERPDAGEAGAAGGNNNPQIAMALPTGREGRPDAMHQAGHTTIEARPDSSDQMTREEAIEIARQAGIFGSVKLNAAIGEIASTINYTQGFGATTTIGLDGPEGDGFGSFGHGRSGDGQGTCLGALCGTINGGPGYKLGYLKNGPPGGFGFPNGHGPGLREHLVSVPHDVSVVVSVSTYDKSIVRRYIRRHINEISYCYEKQLLAHPTLGGEVRMTFLIAPNGHVQAASGAGFDTQVTSCLAGVLQSIEFPPPGDGGGVQVNYPFNFHAPSQQ